jgi:electron transfer flavoprotein beta subunit
MMKYKKARSKAEIEIALNGSGTNESESKLKKLVKKETKALAKKELLIKQWDLDYLDADLTFCGRDGSPTKVHRIQNVVLTAQESVQVEPTESGIAEMVHGLIEGHTIG